MNKSTKQAIISDATDIAGRLHYSVLRLIRLMREGSEAKGLTVSKLGVLGRLSHGGESTSTALAAYLRIQPQSLTRLLSDLEQHRLISRRPSEVDHRQNLLAITEDGARLLNENLHHQHLKLAQLMVWMLTPAEQEILHIAAGLIDQLATASRNE